MLLDPEMLQGGVDDAFEVLPLLRQQFAARRRVQFVEALVGLSLLLFLEVLLGGNGRLASDAHGLDRSTTAFATSWAQPCALSDFWLARPGKPPDFRV